MRIGLCGFGRFGKVLYEGMLAIGRVPDVVADPRLEERAGVVHSIEELLSQLDAVIIATPPDTHLDLIVKALNAGTHVFCEKPIVYPVNGASALHQLQLIDAQRDGMVVHVDHTLCYCPKRVKAISKGHSIYTMRANHEANPHGIDVIWDLLIHDVAAVIHALNGLPKDLDVLYHGEDRVEVSMTFVGRGSQRMRVRCTAEAGKQRRRDLIIDGNEVEMADDMLAEKRPPVEVSLLEFFSAIEGNRASMTGLGHAQQVSQVLQSIGRVDE